MGEYDDGDDADDDVDVACDDDADYYDDDYEGDGDDDEGGGLKYYAKVILSQDKNQSFLTESKLSELSEGIDSLCPNGAYCGIPNSGGILLNDTTNLNGYYTPKKNGFLSL